MTAIQSSFSHKVLANLLDKSEKYKKDVEVVCESGSGIQPITYDVRHFLFELSQFLPRVKNDEGKFKILKKEESPSPTISRVMIYLRNKTNSLYSRYVGEFKVDKKRDPKSSASYTLSYSLGKEVYDNYNSIQSPSQSITKSLKAVITSVNPLNFPDLPENAIFIESFDFDQESINATDELFQKIILDNPDKEIFIEKSFAYFDVLFRRGFVLWKDFSFLNKCHEYIDLLDTKSLESTELDAVTAHKISSFIHRHQKRRDSFTSHSEISGLRNRLNALIYKYKVPYDRADDLNAFRKKELMYLPIECKKLWIRRSVSHDLSYPDSPPSPSTSLPTSPKIPKTISELEKMFTTSPQESAYTFGSSKEISSL